MTAFDFKSPAPGVFSDMTKGFLIASALRRRKADTIYKVEQDALEALASEVETATFDPFTHGAKEQTA